MRSADLPALPGPPHAELKEQILVEFLQNPFLDEDPQALSMRLGVARVELTDALSGLCQSHFLKPAGSRGYALDLESVVVNEAPEKVLTLPGETLVAQQDVLPPEPFPEDLIDFPEDLVDVLPFGVILLHAGGSLEFANRRAADWLGLPADELDAAGFARITGFDPLQVPEGGSVVSFSLKEPRALEISMHPCSLAIEPAVLIILQDVSLQQEVARVLSRLQEELFVRLHGEMVEPLLLIQQFLEDPDTAQLGQARAALEQINLFLEEFFLTGKNGTTPPVSEEDDEESPW